VDKRTCAEDTSAETSRTQVAFVLPLSMPLLVPVARYRLTWFFPAMMVLGRVLAAREERANAPALSGPHRV
jgi:hypothetical protein